MGVRSLTLVPLTVATVAVSVLALIVTPFQINVYASPGIPAPVHHGALRISGQPRDGGTVAAVGLSWRAPRLPRGMRLLSFEVGYSWQACDGSGHCVSAADSAVTPFAARRYVVGHADTGRRLRVTETATEVVETQASTFSFTVVRGSVSVVWPASVRAYRRGAPPTAAFVNGVPERRTASAEEYFQVTAPHYNAADGRPAQWYRIDLGRWRPMPASRVFYTGSLALGPHRVAVRTANRAGSTAIGFGWRVVRLPAPAACRPAAARTAGRPGAGRPCWYPPHLAADHRPMRWDWQIGRVTPLERTGPHAVDIYDIDGFLTSSAEVGAIHSRWQASTLAHPKAVCYLDLAWEDYRPDASPSAGVFPAAVLGSVYNGYPEERWVDLRQLDALKPMLRERIGMCARKGFDAVELDDIDGYDPPSTTGFWLTPGDMRNFLGFAFNEIHRYGMTGLWKNAPSLSMWGRQYADGAVVEECYVGQNCSSWAGFTADVTPRQPTGKWVGEAEYAQDQYVCDPGQRCPGPRAFSAFCRTVYSPSGGFGFAAVKFDVDLDGALFYPCPRGT
jgi:Glycoside-hydrolase family GH114